MRFEEEGSNRTSGVLGNMTIFASFSYRVYILSYKYVHKQVIVRGNRGKWAFAVMAVGFSEGFDSRLGTCAFRGKECGVAGVRW